MLSRKHGVAKCGVSYFLLSGGQLADRWLCDPNSHGYGLRAGFCCLNHLYIYDLPYTGTVFLPHIQVFINKKIKNRLILFTRNRILSTVINF